jgi:hypothetical protein
LDGSYRCICNPGYRVDQIQITYDCDYRGYWKIIQC